ncbi:pyocin activator PrtN family protein [Pseudoalteromonas sp. 5Ae-yellow]|uniref:pyocin activator PrtN family protein n=1 Tax=Pseudoalteromonas TaxID=53246 RepID=UPI0015F6E7DF|nr:pyocin activator PrtN family protein [Pseudoalteromonas sp. 5Ae-yellow]
MNKAKAKDLPIPTFKIGSSAKAPYYIHLNDLAEYIDAQRAKAKEEWSRVNT